MRSEAKQSALRIIFSSLLYRQQVGVFVNKLQTESNKSFNTQSEFTALQGAIHNLKWHIKFK